MSQLTLRHAEATCKKNKQEVHDILLLYFTFLSSRCIRRFGAVKNLSLLQEEIKVTWGERHWHIANDEITIVFRSFFQVFLTSVTFLLWTFFVLWICNSEALKLLHIEILYRFAIKFEIKQKNSKKFPTTFCSSNNRSQGKKKEIALSQHKQSEALYVYIVCERRRNRNSTV